MWKYFQATYFLWRFSKNGFAKNMQNNFCEQTQGESRKADLKPV